MNHRILTTWGLLRTTTAVNLKLQSKDKFYGEQTQKKLNEHTNICKNLQPWFSDVHEEGEQKKI